jgi:hypothetical protein
MVGGGSFLVEYTETVSDQSPGGDWVNFNSSEDNGTSAPQDIRVQSPVFQRSRLYFGL